VVERLLAGRDKFLKAQRLGIPIVDEGRPPLKRKRKISSLVQSSKAVSQRDEFEGELDPEQYGEPDDAAMDQDGEEYHEQVENGEEQTNDFVGDDEQV
jgi:hypothetical protein